MSSPTQVHVQVVTAPNSVKTVEEAIDLSRQGDSGSILSLESGTLPSKAPTATRLCVIMVALNMALFLATTDTTIVSTSLPTIVADLGGSQNDYAWVGVSYLLMETSFQPLYAKLSDVLGRKIVLFASMAIFLVSSCLCGASQSMLMLILCRGFQGVGAGGIVAMAWIIPDDMIPDAEGRAKWTHLKSFTWGSSAVAGPLLGGVFSGKSDNVSWRWGFFINIPVGGIAAVLLCLFLVPQHVNTTKSWKQVSGRFDYLGLVLLVSGTAALIVGFSNASSVGFISPLSLPLLLGGVVVFALGVVNEAFTKRDAVLPPTLFKSKEIALLLVMTFFHNFAFTAGTFYLALYFQAVDGSSAFMAGVLMLPYSLGSCLVSLPAGRWGEAIGLRRVYWCGLVIATLGFGLMIQLNERSASSLQELFPLIAAVGIGLLFHCFKAGMHRALPSREDDAGATSTFFLVRFIAATTGLSISGAIFDSRFAANLSEGFTLQSDVSGVDYRALHSILPLDVRNEVLQAVSSALSSVWLLCTLLLGSALLISLFARHHPGSFKRPCWLWYGKGRNDPTLPAATAATPSDGASITPQMEEKAISATI